MYKLFTYIRIIKKKNYNCLITFEIYVHVSTDSVFKKQDGPQKRPDLRMKTKTKKTRVIYDYVTVCRIQGTNLDILVHTPGRFASAHPIPQLMMPARK